MKKMNIGELVTVKTAQGGALDEKHTPYSAEIRLFSCVQQGDVGALLAQLKNIDSLIVMGRMSEDDVMQYKYMAVSTITLATRYAIQGGISEAKAYDFSDRVIKKIDTLTDKDSILMCLGLEIINLTKEVKKNKKQPAFSPHVRSCIRYINEHLADRISVECVAIHCGISADYLSQIFKKEIGENLSSYILRQKLEKAKSLLSRGKTIKEICAEIGFSSPSYFGTVFRRFYNMTPSDFVKLTKQEP
ncbi:MAG: helix-turn-helix transcriptional regulator [Clostridia bacterium]|nr:helix-turn-helix transcriptional regulator [Clostridia bacterium]